MRIMIVGTGSMTYYFEILVLVKEMTGVHI
jgi:ketopantoate reductase